MTMRFCAQCGVQVQPGWRHCESCGAAVGGAPAPVASSRAVPILIIVIVLLAIIPVTGIIAAIAIPNLVTAMQRAKQKRTMADMRSLATAIEAYATDNNTYPPEGANLDDLEKLLTPKYMTTMLRFDGWNHPFGYHCIEPEADSARCVGYALQSGGKDGLFDALPESLEPSTMKHFDCDILYTNGKFVWYPEGAQTGGQ